MADGLPGEQCPIWVLVARGAWLGWAGLGMAAEWYTG